MMEASRVTEKGMAMPVYGLELTTDEFDAIACDFSGPSSPNVPTPTGRWTDVSTPICSITG